MSRPKTPREPDQRPADKNDPPSRPAAESERPSRSPASERPSPSRAPASERPSRSPTNEGPSPSRSPASEGPSPSKPHAEGEGRVIRDSEGVIVGARSAGPKILGFIDVSKNRPSGPPRRDSRPGARPDMRGKPDAGKPDASRPDASKPGQAPAIAIDPSKPLEVELVDGERPQGRASARKAREVRQNRRLPGRKLPRRGGQPSGSGTAEMSAEKKRVRVDEAISIGELAKQMGVKAPKVIRSLYGMGIRKVTVNSTIDVDTAELVATEFGYRVEDVSFDESELIDDDETDEDEGEPRAPVITVLGHVDHGKTTLLDRLRRANVAGGEAGGITQHVAAYRIETNAGPMVFVDTPGHSAFSAMRERGANLTDIAIVIIAANDGIMPTTIEALEKVKQAEVALIIAANKVDLPDADLPKIERQLMEHGILTETYGGEVPLVPISAKHGQGIDSLIEQIGVLAELLELRANPEGRAIGVVLESRVDRGRGVIATVLVQNGTLQRGDIVVAGESSGRVSALVPSGGASEAVVPAAAEPEDKKGKKAKPAKPVKTKPVVIESSGPSTVIDIVGFDEPPQVGYAFNVVEDEKSAKQLVTHRKEQRRRKDGALSGGGPTFADRLAAERRSELPSLALVVRADVQGSLEAIEQIIEEVRSSKITTKIISTGVGAITEGDVKLATTARQSGANVRPAIFGFGVKAAGKVASMAEAEGIPVRSSRVIYELGEQLQQLMLDQLEPTFVEHPIGRAEVRKAFPTSFGVVCGCRVVSGKITRTAGVRVIRDGEVIKQGKIASLRILVRDVREVGDGHECGILIADFETPREGDVIEAFELEAIPPTL
ncbi:translation initiation factor IF-2 N-terminal domain-containing protein [Nannocystaceae bacterium ST9]